MNLALVPITSLDVKSKNIPIHEKKDKTLSVDATCGGGTLCEPQNLWFWSVLHRELWKEKLNDHFIEIVSFKTGWRLFPMSQDQKYT